MSEASVVQDRAAPRPLAAFAGLAALGIVYGDLGTSPLYVMSTVLEAAPHPDRLVALGVLSLIVWALIIIVSIKYCLFVMRADNHGEGGILALMALIDGGRGGRRWAVTAMALFGAALIYGDGIITPAISVLSAVEGINVATDVVKPYVLPIAVVVLVALFASQTYGTEKIGRVFGPIMLAWFVVAGLLGLAGVLRRPEVLAALNPLYGVRFLARDGWGAFAVLGGVFLAVTGGEAMYADMGHVGKRPIQLAWYFIALPALLLNYAGQTALLLDNPADQDNLFFRLAPSWSVIPLVVLATAATVIASQAIITGAFSLTRQGMQLGWLPGVSIRQTSDAEYGQIYVPLVNWVMMVLTVGIAIGFGSSERLAGAFGTAVSTTMLLTTVLLFFAMRECWRWSLPVALLVGGVFIAVDVAFFAANLLKIADGGWLPLTAGAILFLIMTTWHRGLEAAGSQVAKLSESPERFLQRLHEGEVPRVPGVAVFLTRHTGPVPRVIVRHVGEMGALQKDIVSLTLRFEQTPRVAVAERVVVEQVLERFWHVTARFGFMEVPDLAAAMDCARDHGCDIDLDHAMYFGTHDMVVASERHPRLPRWRQILFSFLFRNAVRSVDRFNLPAARFVEVGRQIAL